VDHAAKVAFDPFAECADDCEMNVLSHNQSVLMSNIAIIHDFALMALQVLLRKVGNKMARRAELRVQPGGP